MATIIDALIVTLGLDGKGFTEGSDKARKSLKSTSEESDRMAKNIESRGKQAAASLGAIRNQALALLAVFTAGMGIKAFTANTITSAASLGRMSSNLSISTEKLTAYQRANELAGGSAASMTAQLKESATEISKARMGLGSDSAAWFYRMGGQDVRTFKDGNEYLLARSKIISDIYKQDPARAMTVAANMGVSEDTFNLLKQGPEQVKKMIAEAQRLSPISKRDADNADKLRAKFLQLGWTFDATGTKVLLALVPTFDKLIARFQNLADWVDTHKEDIAKWAADAINWFDDFFKAVDKAAQSVGGWKNVLIALAAIKVLSIISPLFTLAAALLSIGKALGLISAGAGAITVLGGAALIAGGAGLAAMAYSSNLNTDEQATLNAINNPAANLDVQKDAVKKLQALGWTREQAVGIVANLQAESSMNPGAVGDSGQAFGIAQWHPDRQAKFKGAFGVDIRDSTMDQQLAFVDWELRNSERAAGERLKGASTPQNAASVVSEYYERPKDRDGEKLKRAGMSGALYGSMDLDDAAGKNSLPLNTVNMVGVVTGRPSLPLNQWNAGNSSETNINGPITIVTQATDARGIARDLGSQIEMLAPQANTGLR